MGNVEFKYDETSQFQFWMLIGPEKKNVSYDYNIIILLYYFYWVFLCCLKLDKHHCPHMFYGNDLYHHSSFYVQLKTTIGYFHTTRQFVTAWWWVINDGPFNCASLVILASEAEYTDCLEKRVKWNSGPDTNDPWELSLGTAAPAIPLPRMHYSPLESVLRFLAK